MNSGVYIERHIKRDWNEWIYLSFINQDWVRTNCEKDKDNRSQWEQLFYLHKMYNESNIFLKFKNTRFYSNKKTSTAHLTLYLLFFFWGDHSLPLTFPPPFCFLWCLPFAALFTIDPRSQTRAIHSIGPPFILYLIHYSTGCGLWSLIGNCIGEITDKWKVGQNLLVARSFFCIILVFLVVNKVWVTKKKKI